MSDILGSVTLDRRFRGPPDSANGGFACGVVAGMIGGVAEVTLRRGPLHWTNPWNSERGLE